MSQTGRLLHLSSTEGRRDNSLYTYLDERTNFQSTQLFWSWGNSPSIRLRPRPPSIPLPEAALTRTAHFIINVRVSASSLSHFCFLLTHSPRSLLGVVDVEVVLGSSVPLDEAEAAHELERLQRRSDERLLAGACKEMEHEKRSKMVWRDKLIWQGFVFLIQ